MTYRLNLLGMLISNGRIEHSLELHSSSDIVKFLKANLFQEWGDLSGDRVVIVETVGMKPIFEAIDGVDMYSELHEYGVDLPQIYRDVNKQQSQQLAELSREGDVTDSDEDSIGLSVEEMVMRKETLRDAREAKTVSDIAQLVQGTYFDAWFETIGHDRCWGYFDHWDYSVQPMDLRNGGWSEHRSKKRVILNSNARVKFNGSGEDVLSFIILDPPN
jgi:hypothetical protein